MSQKVRPSTLAHVLLWCGLIGVLAALVLRDQSDHSVDVSPWRISASSPLRPLLPPVDDPLQRRLERRIDVRFENISIRAAVVNICDGLGITVRFDERKVKHNRQLSSHVSMQLKDVTGEDVLNLLLGPSEAAAIRQGSELLVTSQAVADRWLETRSYPLPTLSANGRAVDAPETWDFQGGPGSLDSWEDILVVSQTEAVHAQIELWLKQQRDKAGR